MAHLHLAAAAPLPEYRPLAVFDIDGVLADVRHRLPFLGQRPKDWDGFFAAAGEDPLLAPGAAMVRASGGTGAVTYLTGRPERLRAVTESWLERHQLPAGPVYMRADADRRPAQVVKLAWLRRLAASATIAVVVDDDAEVCAAVTAAGFPVRRAEWMASEPVLRVAQHDEGRT